MNHNILITGGSGFIGRAVCADLVASGHRLTVLTRKPAVSQKFLPPQVRCISTLSDATSEPFSAVINLAGEGLADKRWSAARKAILRSSRIDLTRDLVAWLTERSRQGIKAPEVMLSGSAIGYYGPHGAQPLTETSEPDDPGRQTFPHQLCRDWEQAAQPVEELGTRLVRLRIGVVVGPISDGGAVRAMLPPFRFGLGGWLGTGQQIMSWIDRRDLVRMIAWLLDAPVAGAVNATAPDPVSNKGFSKALGKALSRPVLMPVPAFALKLMVGEMSEILLTGQAVVPQVASDAGFTFAHSDVHSAIADAVA